MTDHTKLRRAAATNAVALSGGKDSTALALLLRERMPHVVFTYICTPTGDELPELLEHWRTLETLLDAPILRLQETTLAELIHKNNMLPNHRARWCTRQLKIEVCQRWIDAQPGEVVLYVGLRADEAGREGGIFDRCSVRFPLREWGIDLDGVWNTLRDRSITIPKRTDCARCFWQKLPEWWELWKEYPEIYQSAVDDETRLEHTFRSPQRDTWPASLAELRDKFAAGHIPRGVDLQSDLYGFDYSEMKCRTCSL